MSSSHTIIFGGTKGIGRVLAQSLAGDGEHVTVLGRSGATCDLAAGSYTRGYSVDFLQPAAVKETLNRVADERPAPNHLVFCQRFRGEGDRWEGEWQASLTTTRDAIEFFAPRFEEGAAHSIAMVGSLVGSSVAADQPPGYHIAKSGLVQLARYYAVLLGPRGVRVNVVSPGTTVKPEAEAFYAQNEPIQKLYRTITPLGRLGRADDVAGVIRFLLSPASAFMTGQNLIVDGGVSLHSQESLSRKLLGL